MIVCRICEELIEFLDYCDNAACAFKPLLKENVMPTPEYKVKRKIREYLKEIGAYQFWPVQTGYGAATIDCLCCYKGQFFGIEVKRADTRPKPTPRQETVLDEIATAGGGRIVAYDVEDVRKVIA